ncbi:ABC1-domain-containing protein [Coniochaeta sp. PMI_546]|nr:ABC1-domain-containing protein [Coniochaeta sp. PMI_546]
MRLADVLIDLAAVLNASRSVASKHVALRGRQLDHYAKTSSIATALKQQTRLEPRSRDTRPVDTTETETASPRASEPHSPPAATVPLQRPPQLQGRVGDQGQSGTGKSEFVPAPWASLASSGIVHQTSPTTPLVDLKPKTGVPPLEEDDDVPPGVDISALFRTSRGSKILESLKEPGGESDTTLPSAQTMTSPASGGTTSNLPPPQAGSVPVTEPATTTDLDQKFDSPVRTQSQGELVIEHAGSTTLEKPSVTDRETQVITDTEPHQDVTKERPTEDIVGTQTQLSKEDVDLARELAAAAPAAPRYQLRESKVPATRISRLWNYGGLAAGMIGGAIGEGLSRAVGGGGQGSMMLSAANMERLVTKLSRMRGAALKLGQMMSFQDSKMLPAPIQEVLQRVQDRADYMPAWQRDKVLVSNLGPEWRELFDEFEEMPIAAASIGQVHRATLRSNSAKVAVKIQFPGVADSINSDLDNIGVLLAATRLLPKGLYLNKTIDNARTELGWECDYEREAVCGERYRALLADETDVFVVPKIYLEASGKQVLTMEFMEGVGVTRVASFNQEQRDWIGTQILRLCLREITEFKFMQTDPNWTNFLYNAQKNKLELLDFGASREYPDRFITLYVRLLEAASRLDRAAVKTLSEELGYLTGHESKAMLDAHITSVLTLAEPFLDSAPEVYDFRDQTITERVKGQIPVMIRERLAPPPEETYSLHRKLSGAFLLCARLGSRVRCRDLFEQALKKTDLVR